MHKKLCIKLFPIWTYASLIKAVLTLYIYLVEESDELHTCAKRVLLSVRISPNKGDITLSRKPLPCGVSSHESEEKCVNLKACPTEYIPASDFAGFYPQSIAMQN